MRRVDVRADEAADGVAQAQTGRRVVHAKPGVHFQRDALHAMVGSEADRLFPIRDEHLVPLPFEHGGVLGRPGARDPRGLSGARVGAGTARKGDDAVDADLPREHAGRLEIRLERRSRLFVRMHAVAVHRQGRNAHVVPGKRLEQGFARGLVFRQDERVGMRLARIAAHAQFELVDPQTGKVAKALVEAVIAQNAADYTDFHIAFPFF